MPLIMHDSRQIQTSQLPFLGSWVEFKRQVAQEFIAGETLHGLAARHGVSRNLIRVWVMKFEAGAFDEDAEAAGLLRDRDGLRVPGRDPRCVVAPRGGLCDQPLD
jgi:hypothetical protein